MHGKMSVVEINNSCEIFKGLPEKIEVARYHSLIAETESLPDCLEVVSKDAIGEIMAVKHKEKNTFGVQFHPESIMTPEGKLMLRNFIELAGRKQAEA